MKPTTLYFPSIASRSIFLLRERISGTETDNANVSRRAALSESQLERAVREYGAVTRSRFSDETNK